MDRGGRWEPTFCLLQPAIGNFRTWHPAEGHVGAVKPVLPAHGIHLGNSEAREAKASWKVSS